MKEALEYLKTVEHFIWLPARKDSRMYVLLGRSVSLRENCTLSQTTRRKYISR